MATRDDQNPNGGGDWFDQNAPPAPAASGDPWTPQELAESQAWANQYYTSHQIPNTVGVPDDLANGYVRQRRNGASHAEAMNYLTTVLPGVLGWDKYTAASPDAPPSPPPGPSAPPPTATPPGVPTSGFGAAPPPYASDPNAPVYQPLDPYTAPLWTGGDYVPPTVEDLYASPGYQARLDRRLQGDSRHFAAQGTILNGGTLKALDRSAQDYATSEYQTLNANKYDQYKTRYAQFADAAGRDLASRSVNAADANTTFANRTATYSNGNARTLSDYITNVTNNRNSELDYWSRLMDLNRTGADLAGGSR